MSRTSNAKLLHFIFPLWLKSEKSAISGSHTVFLKKVLTEQHCTNGACGLKKILQAHMYIIFCNIFKFISHCKGEQNFCFQINSKTLILRKKILNLIFSTTFPLINYSGIKGSFKNNIYKNANCFSWRNQ